MKANNWANNWDLFFVHTVQHTMTLIFEDLVIRPELSPGNDRDGRPSAD